MMNMILQCKKFKSVLFIKDYVLSRYVSLYFLVGYGFSFVIIVYYMKTKDHIGGSLTMSG